MFNCKLLVKHNIGYITFIIKQYINYNVSIRRNTHCSDCSYVRPLHLQ